jgi:hypothetical protein
MPRRHYFVSNDNFTQNSSFRKSTNQQTLTKILVSRTEVFLHPRTRDSVNRETTLLVDTRAELEAAILLRNRKHFAKAAGTPFTIPPLEQDFDILQATAAQPMNKEIYFI